MTPEIKEASSKAEAEKQRWEEETLRKVLDKTPERKKSFEGVSLEPVERLYTEADVEGIEVGFPGEFPYKRGIHPTGYRGKLWTMRQFAGFSSPENTNARFKYLLEHGQTGLSVAYDLPALMGLDADTTAAGNQAFRWVGTAALTGAGQVGFFTSGGTTIIRASNDADLATEFEIQLTGIKTLTAMDFYL